MLDDLPDDHDLINLDAALAHVTCWGTAVECGAHRGIWTRRLVDRFARVIAFEPVPENFERLPPEAHRYCAAVGRTSGFVRMQPGTENTGQWHVGQVDTANTGQWHVHADDVIPMLPLDQFTISRLGFLKLDVEGYEWEALHGAEQTILRERPVICMEENICSERYGIPIGQCSQWLIDRGYRLVEKKRKDCIFVYDQ